MNKNIYHLFLFLITFTRGIIEAFSLVLLYKKGFGVRDILIFLTFMYVFGIVVNYISLKINYKVVLIVSSLLYGFSYLFLTFMGSSFGELVIFALLLSGGTYSYHSIRHLLALSCNIKNTSLIVNVMFLATIVASIVGTYIVFKLSFEVVSIILFFCSVISLIPIFKLDVKMDTEEKKVVICKEKIVFNILEQFKVVFLELQPLFLYIYVSSSVLYVGEFNIIINLASLVVLFFLRKIAVDRYYIYICLILGMVLLWKVSVSSMVMLLLIAVMEGIFVKLYERGSLSYLYDINNNSVREYLMVEEFIFFGSKAIMMGIFLVMDINLRSILFICIIGIIVSGFVYRFRDN